MEVRIPAEGAVLHGQLLSPDGAPRVAVLLNGATGVRARFYGAFAEWLVTQGMACLTYDYRDFGWSGSARGSRATMTDWGVRDQQAARDFLADAVAAPLWVVGHSLGGMMLPFQRGLSGIDRVVLVASGAVHVTDHPWPYQAFARAFWAPGLPALARRLGYLPLRAVGVGHDLPAGVYAQWRGWCLSRAFHAADPDLPAMEAADLDCAMRVVAVADDALCPPAAAWRLMGIYPAAWKRQAVLRPEAFGLDRLGHLDVLGARGAPAWAAVMGLDGVEARRWVGPGTPGMGDPGRGAVRRSA